MTIYKKTKFRSAKGEWKTTIVPLPEGDQEIEHAGLQIPVNIKGNEVTVYVDSSRGDRERGYICGFPGYMDLRVDVFINQTGEFEPVIMPRDNRPVIRIGVDDSVVWVERHDEQPVVAREQEA